MNIGTISTRYATALLKYAEEAHDEKSVYDSMCTLIEVYRKVPELRAMLGNPALSNDTKYSLLVSACGQLDTVSACVQKFLQLVVRNRRVEMLQFMAYSYVELYRQKTGLITCKVTTAAPVDTKTTERFKAVIKQKCQGTVDLSIAIDPEIQGGFIIEYDTYRLDASLKRSLQRVKRSLLQNN